MALKDESAYIEDRILKEMLIPNPKKKFKIDETRCTACKVR